MLAHLPKSVIACGIIFDVVSFFIVVHSCSACVAWIFFGAYLVLLFDFHFCTCRRRQTYSQSLSVRMLGHLPKSVIACSIIFDVVSFFIVVHSCSVYVVWICLRVFGAFV